MNELKAALEHARSLASDLAERLAGVESELQASYQRWMRENTRENTDGWNQTARRLRGAGSRDEWIRILVEASGPYCGKAAVFPVTRKGLVIGDGPEVPLASAPAFESAVESKDTVVAVGTPRELSPQISSLLGDASSKKIYLFPVVVRQNAVAVLYAEPGEGAVDVSALELLASVAGIWEAEAGKLPAADLILITGKSSAAAVRPKWTDLPKEEQEQHLRAQRFARTRVAQLMLHNGQQVRDGRLAGNLYGALKEEIEAGREAFRKDFIDTCPSMVDYLHLELQRTLAKDHPDGLGPEYPGPMPVGAGSTAG